MKRILFINTVFEGGGAAKIARQLFEFVNCQTGVEGCFAYGRGKAVNQPRVFKFGFFIETIFQVVLVRFFGLEGWGSPCSTSRLINYIKTNKFDLVHLHNIHGYYLNYIKLFKFLKQNNIPTVWTLHDEWCLTWLPAHSMGCDHCLSGEGTCINKYVYPKTYNKLLIRWLLKRKRKAISLFSNLYFVSTARWLTEKVNLIYPQCHIMTIRNGVVNKFSNYSDKQAIRLKNRIDNETKIILFSASNLTDENKGLQYVVAAARELSSQKGILFLLAGKGKTIELSNVLSLGYLNGEQLDEVYSLSDIYCFLSAVETMPLSLLEARAAGLFILASNIPANVEALEGYSRCKLLNFEDINNLAKIILGLNSDSNIITKPAAYIVPDCCEEYLKLYH